MNSSDIQLLASELRNELETVIFECGRIIAQLDNGVVDDTIPSMLYAKTIQRKLREEIMEAMNLGVSGFDITKALEAQ